MTVEELPSSVQDKWGRYKSNHGRCPNGDRYNLLTYRSTLTRTSLLPTLLPVYLPT